MLKRFAQTESPPPPEAADTSDLAVFNLVNIRQFAAFNLSASDSAYESLGPALVALKLFLVLAGVIAVQQIESHVLQPFLLGRAVSVHPLAVILAITAGVVFGL